MTKMGVKRSLNIIFSLRSNTTLMICTGSIEIQIRIYLFLVYHPIFDIFRNFD
jgi:hypothetical protein